MIYHVNEFNSIISRLISIDFEFEDDVQTLILLSSLPDSWSSTMTKISSPLGCAEMIFECVYNLILSEVVCRQCVEESLVVFKVLKTNEEKPT